MQWKIINVFSGLGNIWMPALAHAAMNLCGTLLLTEMIMRRDELFLQSFWIAEWGLVAVLCLISLNRKKPMPWQSTEAQSTRTY